jgi:hypothetical protein
MHHQPSRSPTSSTRRSANSATCVRLFVHWSTGEPPPAETLDRGSSRARPLRSARRLDVAMRLKGSLYGSLADVASDASFPDPPFDRSGGAAVP